MKLAAKGGADVVVVDGMEGGTAASPEILQDHTGIPTLAAVCEARARSGGPWACTARSSYHRRGHPAAASTWPRRWRWARTPSTSARPRSSRSTATSRSTSRTTHALGAEPGACHHCHTGRCPVGITTQDPELMARLPIDEAAERVANFLTR